MWEVSWHLGLNSAETVPGGVASQLQEVKGKDTLTAGGREEPNGRKGDGNTGGMC